jgi:hypothetical protein
MWYGFYGSTLMSLAHVLDWLYTLFLSAACQTSFVRHSVGLYSGDVYFILARFERLYNSASGTEFFTL